MRGETGGIGHRETRGSTFREILGDPGLEEGGVSGGGVRGCERMKARRASSEKHFTIFRGGSGYGGGGGIRIWIWGGGDFPGW